MTLAYQRTTIFCRDANRSLAFYRDILGFVVIEDKTISGPAAGALLQLSDCTMRILLLAPTAQDDPVVGLFEVSKAPVESAQVNKGRIAYGQAAIVVSTDNFEKIHADLVRADTPFLTPPVKYVKKIASARSPAGIYHEMIFYDPDNVLVSVLQILPLTQEQANS